MGKVVIEYQVPEDCVVDLKGLSLSSKNAIKLNVQSPDDKASYMVELIKFSQAISFTGCEVANGIWTQAVEALACSNETLATFSDIRNGVLITINFTGVTYNVH